MKNKRLKKLVKTLRSGKYKPLPLIRCKKQYYLGFTHMGEKRFSFLGVCCEVAKENGVKVEKHVKWMNNEKFFIYSYDGKISYLPKSVCDYFGFFRTFGEYLGTTLDELEYNGKSFKEIADFIEQNEDNLYVLTNDNYI